jgi:hypothetical protein
MLEAAADERDIRAGLSQGASDSASNAGPTSGYESDAAFEN